MGWLHKSLNTEFIFTIKMFLPEREHVSLFAIRENISQIFQLRFAAWSTSEVSCIYHAEMILTSVQQLILP